MIPTPWPVKRKPIETGFFEADPVCEAALAKASASSPSLATIYARCANFVRRVFNVYARSDKWYSAATPPMAVTLRSRVVLSCAEKHKRAAFFEGLTFCELLFFVACRYQGYRDSTDSMMTWPLVPPYPNEETLVLRIGESIGQGAVSACIFTFHSFSLTRKFGICQHAVDRQHVLRTRHGGEGDLLSGFKFWKYATPGIVADSVISAAFITANMPLAASECPMFGLTIK